MNNWTKKFAWDRGKSTLRCQEKNLILIWEATDPWKLWKDGEEIKDFPFLHAEDWWLAIKYAEKIP